MYPTLRIYCVFMQTVRYDTVCCTHSRSLRYTGRNTEYRTVRYTQQIHSVGYTVHAFGEIATCAYLYMQIVRYATHTHTHTFQYRKNINIHTCTLPEKTK